MKFINYLENISGIGIYPLTSLLIFFLFFLILIWRIWKMDKKLINEVSNIPLDQENNEKMF